MKTMSPDEACWHARMLADGVRAVVVRPADENAVLRPGEVEKYRRANQWLSENLELVAALTENALTRIDPSKVADRSVLTSSAQAIAVLIEVVSEHCRICGLHGVYVQVLMRDDTATKAEAEARQRAAMTN